MLLFNAVPNDWATIEITESTTPTENTNYTLLCTVTFHVDLGGTPSLVWLDQSGREMHSGNNETSWHALTTDKQTLALMFKSLQPTDQQLYTCNVSVYSLYLDITIFKASERDLILRSKYTIVTLMLECIRYCYSLAGEAAFQLKFGPIEYCIHWSVSF